jgi:hypothetical protein
MSIFLIFYQKFPRTPPPSGPVKGALVGDELGKQ